MQWWNTRSGSSVKSPLPTYPPNKKKKSAQKEGNNCQELIHWLSFERRQYTRVDNTCAVRERKLSSTVMKFKHV